MKRTTLIAALATSLAFAACGHESPDTEACEHLAGGPAQAITAAATTADAPEVANDHKRYDVALVDVTGGKGGSVKFASPGHGTFVLFLDADVPVTVTDSRGGIYPLVSAKSSEECGEIKGRHQFDTDVGTYFLTFGPTSLEKVGLVLEQGVHEH